ncbi:hypothetical protein V8F06_008662 [Rhypophila decipiens]
MIARVKLNHARDETTVTAPCYDDCNNAYLEAQKTGKTSALCEPDSSFNNLYHTCMSCLDSEGDPKAQAKGKAYLGPKFQDFIDYCQGPSTAPVFKTTMTGNPLFDSVITVIPGVTVSASFYTTLTTTAWIPRTLSDNSTSSEIVTVEIPLETLDRGFVDGSRTSIPNSSYAGTRTTSATDSSSQTKGSDPQASGDTGSNLPSTTIVGISIGVAVAVLILAVLGWMCHIGRRKRRARQALQLAEHAETKAQLHGDSLVSYTHTEAHEIDSRSINSPVEIGDGPGCFELDSCIVCSELESTTGKTTT